MVSIRRKRLIAEAAAAAAEAARLEALPPIEKLQMIQEKLGKVVLLSLNFYFYFYFL